MACFIMPNSPYVNLNNMTVVPRVLVGYMPAQHSALQGTPFSQASPVVATPGQLPVGSSLLTAASVPLGLDSRTFHRNLLHKAVASRGFKRKASDSDSSSPSGDNNNTELKPLYCKICKVQLNAPCQAKQHYEGKTHAKRLKMYTDGTPDSTTTSDGENSPTEKKPSSMNSNVVVQKSDDINPDIYCKVCGVSFNSPKQSEQHYKGKNHAKRVRGSRPKPNFHRDYGDNKNGPKFFCSVCAMQLGTQDQLNRHVMGSRHITAVQQRQEKDAAAVSLLTARWHHAIPNSSLLPFNGAIHRVATKKPRQDFSMYRTPSGSYYCSCCNVTSSTEPHFIHHMNSKKHQTANAIKKNTQTPPQDNEK